MRLSDVVFFPELLDRIGFAVVTTWNDHTVRSAQYLYSHSRLCGTSSSTGKGSTFFGSSYRGFDFEGFVPITYNTVLRYKSSMLDLKDRTSSPHEAYKIVLDRRLVILSPPSHLRHIHSSLLFNSHLRTQASTGSICSFIQ